MLKPVFLVISKTNHRGEQEKRNNLAPSASFLSILIVRLHSDPEWPYVLGSHLKIHLRKQITDVKLNFMYYIAILETI